MLTIRRQLATVLTAVAAVVGVLFLVAGPSYGADTTPPATPSPSSGTAPVQVNNPTPTQGGNIRVSGSSCTPNSTVRISLDGSTSLGTASTNGSGGYSTVITIPSGTSAGSHQIVVTGAGCNGVKGVSVQRASSSGGSGSGGNLAGTGVAVVGIGALGVVLLVGGGLMLLAGRRRQHV